MSRIRLVLSRLGSSIILDVDIFKSRLKKRACSTNIELDGAEVNFKKAFFSVHTKVFKASSVVPVQKDSKLIGSSKLLNSVFLSFFEKDTRLIIPLLKMVKTGILFNSINLNLFDEVLQLLDLVHRFGRHLSLTPTVCLHFTNL